MKNLPSDAIRAFVTAVDLGSISATAEHLGKSQPATSLQIKRLEEILGKELLIRSNRRIELSQDGRTIVEFCRELLNLNDQIIAQLKDDALAGHITLGIPSEFATTLLPNIVGRFAKAYPNIRLEVFSDLSRNLTAEIGKDKYDIVLALHETTKATRKGLVRSDSLVWVGQDGWSRDRLHELPLVLAQEGCIYRRRVMRSLKQASQAARVVHTNPDLSGIQSAIQAGLGITALAESTVPESLSILEEERHGLPSLGNIDISLQYRKKGRSESVSRLAEFIRSSL